MRISRHFLSIAHSCTGLAILLATSGFLSSCRIAVAVPELTATNPTERIRAGESIALSVPNATPPIQFSVVSGAAQINAEGVLTAGDEGGDVFVSAMDADGRTTQIKVQTIAKLTLTGPVGTLRPGAGYMLGASGGVSPYRFSVVSGSATIDPLSGAFSVSAAGMVSLSVVDAEGYSATIALQISEELTLAITSPTEASVINAALDSPNLSLSGTCTGAGHVEVKVNGSVSGTGGACANGNWSATIDSTVLATGSHVISASITDENGANVNALVSVVKDAVAPVVNGLENDGTAAKTKSWTWTCSESCTYRFAVDTNPATAPAGAYGALTTATQNSGTATYYLHVQARDAAGNESAVVHVSVPLDNAIPSAPPSVDDGTTGTSITEHTVSWTASTDTGSSIDDYEVAIGTAPGGTTVKSWTSVGNVTSSLISGLSLTNGAKYYASVRARDRAGNISNVTQGDGWTAPAAGAGTSQVFTFTGGEQSYTVPWGVTKLLIKAWGAGGGGSQFLGSKGSGGKGGGGAYVSKLIDVLPFDVLTVVVGGGGKGTGPNTGLPGRAGGWPNGAAGPNDDGEWVVDGPGGGGSTAILLNGVRVLEAGGGGGGLSMVDQVGFSAIENGTPGQASSGSCGTPGGKTGAGPGGGGGYCGGAAQAGGFSYGDRTESGSMRLPGNNVAPCQALNCGLGGDDAADGADGLAVVDWTGPFANSAETTSAGWAASGAYVNDAADPLPFSAERFDTGILTNVRLTKTLNLGRGLLSVRARANEGGITVKVGSITVIDSTLVGTRDFVVENTITGSQSVDIYVWSNSDVDDVSHSEIVSFSIPTLLSAPASVGFENGGQLPPGWTAWTGYEEGYLPHAGVGVDGRSGTYLLNLDPASDMGAESKVTYFLPAGSVTFWAKNLTASHLSYVHFAINGAPVLNALPSSAVWTQYGPYAHPGGVVTFEFRASSGWDLGIDDIVFTPQ